MSRGNMKQILFRINSKRDRLLNMYYTTGELAEELGVTRDYVTHSLLFSGKVPYKQEETGRIYINGDDVRKWIETFYDERRNKKESRRLAKNEFLCVKCHRRKIIENPSISKEGNKCVMIAYCPDCGTRMRKYER